MKASVCNKYGGPEIIELLEVEKPTIKEDEILVKVQYSLVTPTDTGFRSGSPFISRLFSGLLKPKARIQGEMYAGMIEEVGSSISEFEVGELVYGTNGMKLGSYAEYIAVKKDTVIRKVPKGISVKDVITLLDGAITSLPYLRDKGNIKKGLKVLIIGASGSVGSYGVTLAKHFGAEVTGVCSTKNEETVKKLGADYVIDYTKEDYTKSSKKYDIVYDAVGKSTFSKCKPILTKEGRYLSTVPGLGAMLKTLLKTKQKGKKNLFMATGLRKADEKHKDLELLEELLINKEITPLIDKEFHLEEMQQAHTYVETGHKVGNVIIHI